MTFEQFTPPILQRLVKYADATGISAARTPRSAAWRELGLPDVRGFTPHLRTVQLAAEPAPGLPSPETATLAELATPSLWLLHDLAHCVWYDYANLLGERRGWRNRNFFLEHHLASEAFAVLLLDYHGLAHTERGGLAVDLKFGDWERLRTVAKRLPDLRSMAFCRDLLNQYLTGTSRWFDKPRTGDGELELFETWRSHESRYSDKQRWYVFLWWHDLYGLPPADQRAVVDDPELVEDVWALLQLFTSEPESSLDRFIEDSQELREGEHAFAELPKYTRPRERYDFRFTDVRALEIEQLRRELTADDRATASNLFLLWQLLAETDPASLSDENRTAVSRLTESAQSPAIDQEAWALVRSLCQDHVDTLSRPPDERVLGAFFLS